MGADPRIGPQFLKVGIGYGGSCFPKDVAAFQSVGKECGVDFSLLQEVTRINAEQRRNFVKKVRTALWTLYAVNASACGDCPSSRALTTCANRRRSQSFESC